MKKSDRRNLWLKLWSQWLSETSTTSYSWTTPSDINQIHYFLQLQLLQCLTVHQVIVNILTAVCTVQIPSWKAAWSIRSCHKQVCAAHNVTKVTSVERLPENLPSGAAQKKGAVLVCNWFHSSRVQLYKSTLPGREWGRSSTVVCLYSTLPKLAGPVTSTKLCTGILKMISLNYLWAFYLHHVCATPMEWKGL